MFNPYPSLPYQIKNYVLNSIIGQGGFAIVYKATNVLYNRDFAVKVICQSKISNRNVSSFEAEIKSLTQLDHPNVIRLYDYFKEDDHLFLVLEYCSGGTLEDKILKEEEMSFEAQIKICSQIVSALNYCYDQNIAHRDIKTSNVLIDGNGRIKVTDFGLSQVISHDQNMHQFGGSLHYYSPEICKKVSFNPFKSDVWALGVLFYRLFTYSYPFDGVTEHEIKTKIIDGFYPEKLTGLIGKVVRKMLTPCPEERISIYQLSKMEIFNSPKVNIFANGGKKLLPIPNQAQVNRLRRFSKGCSNVIFHNSKSNENSPQLAKCMNLFCSQTFLSAPLVSEPT